MYYVYSLIDPLSNEIFYVGKGKGNRAELHLNEKYNTTKNRRLLKHINNIRDKGLLPIIDYVEINMSEDDAYDLERDLICRYGRKGYEKCGTLLNHCIDRRPPDWTGKVHSEETKEKLRQLKLGGKHTDEARRNMSLSKIGHVHSDETKKKIQKSLCKHKYILKHKDGRVVETDNLRQFCADNNLNQANMCKVVNGINKSCKGWMGTKK
jgi:hypothetical protein